MKRSTKQDNVTYKDFSDFSGGWNVKQSAQNIDTDELAEVNNMTFRDQPGRLCTRNGIGGALTTFTNDIDGLYAWNSNVIIKADSKYWLINADGIITDLGTALGDGLPSFAEYDGDLYVCADSQIQKIKKDTYDLSTISDSYSDTVGLFTREGRLCCWRSNDDYKDYIYGSYIGDPTVWTVPDSTDDSLQAVEYQIGYKIQGGVVGVIPFLQDLVVFKEKAVMRFVGSLIPGSDDQAIYEVARNERLANKDSYENIGGELFYLDKLSGVRLITGVDTYGDLLPTDIIPKVNPFIKENLNADTCKLCYLKNHRIIAFCLDNTIIPAYLEYGSNNMPCLKWTFNGNVKGICETTGKSVYIAIDNGIYLMDGEVEDEKFVSCSFSTKELVTSAFYLLRRITVDAKTTSENPNQVAHLINCNDTKISQIFFGSTGSDAIFENYYQVMDNPDPIYTTNQYRNNFVKHQLFRTRTIQINFSGENAPPYILSRFGIECAPVGVIG